MVYKQNDLMDRMATLVYMTISDVRGSQTEGHDPQRLPFNLEVAIILK